MFHSFIDRIIEHAIAEGQKPLPSNGNRPKPTAVADLAVEGLDSTGEEILCFYGRKPPEFAVYRTKQRVSIQFADDKAQADRQRKAIAPLNPIRGEINGLIDGWRTRPSDDRRYLRAMRFDRRVGDALVVAFEDDVTDAMIILARIKQDIVDQRVAWARFEYLLVAFTAALAFIGLCQLVHTPPGHGLSLWASASAGAVGAFFSISIGLRGRTVLPDLLWLANTMDALLRILIGIIGASVLMALVEIGLVKLNIGSGTISAGSGDGAWLRVLVVGFLAGFSERLVPDLLEKATNKPAEAPPRLGAERQPASGRFPPHDGTGGSKGSHPPPHDPKPEAKREVAAKG